jgi:hypothetical protein
MMNAWILTLLLGLAVVVLTMAPAAVLAQTESVTVTIYNQNRALINEIRRMAIPKGRQAVEFKDVAETIDATSLQVRSLTSPESFSVLDQNYEYDLISVQNMLDKYVGKKLQVILPDPGGQLGAKIVRTATLLANNDKPIFRLDSTGEGSSSPSESSSASDGASAGIYVGDYHAVLLPEIPEGLRPQPTLVWLVDNQGEENHLIEVSYLAGNMNWKADYVLKVDRDNTKGSLSGWVTLDNQSGKPFKSAKLKLVAGDVHQVSRQVKPLALDQRRMMAAAPPPEAMQQEEFFEYHLYSLGRTVDIANKQTKQVSLLQSPSVRIEKRLVGRWNSAIYDHPDRSVQKQKLSVYLKFKNVEENGLGIPLPKGIIRAYQESGDGTVVFIGEDRIDHTGKERDAEVKMGEAFDVIVERKLTEYRKIGNNAARFGWELKIKNSKDIPQRVELEETFPGEWRVTESSAKFEKMDGRRIKFIVDAEPSSKDGDTVITYQVEVNW